mmetsp:Transcript_72687/g.199372  ORF Transcript_72687/g.199372 Transcript_72687/m.199372 type:complete len:272 (+) Transcript_72687:839-1654(+)
MRGMRGEPECALAGSIVLLSPAQLSHLNDHVFLARAAPASPSCTSAEAAQRVITVVVPPNATPGERLRLPTDAQAFVTLPEGASPGQSLRVRVPSAATAAAPLGLHKRIKVNAHLLTAAGRSPEVSVYAYKRVKERFHAPTEAYKCAVLRHVKLNDGARPPMLEVLDRTGALQEAWAHPGFAQLSLAAFLYEIGARKKPQPWQVPKTIDEVVAKLETVGVPHTTSPTDFVHDATGINVRLRAAGKSILTRDTFDIARKLLSASSYVLDLDA